MLPLLLPLVSTVVPEMAKWLFPSNPKADTAIQAVSGVVQAVTGGDPTSAAGIAAIGATRIGHATPTEIARAPCQHAGGG
jgi:hypothetical protein